MDEHETEGLDRRRFLAGAAAATVGGTLVSAVPAGASETALAALHRRRRDHDRSHPADLDISEAVSLLRSRKLSSRELAEACLERIDERDPDITAWERVYADEALAAAREADRKLAKSGRHGPPLLCGIPIGFKDIIAVGGKPLTAGSLALEGNIAPADSHAWERARAEGMVLLGQTKTQEFASGNNTQTAGNPTTRAKAPADRATAAAPPSARAPCPSALGLTRAAVFDGPPRRAG